jgi:hypothetical protein
MIPSINKNDHTNHPKFGLFLLTLGNVELQDFVNTLLESICDSMDEDKTTPSDTTKRTKHKTYQKTGFFRNEAAWMKGGVRKTRRNRHVHHFLFFLLPAS